MIETIPDHKTKFLSTAAKSTRLIALRHPMSVESTVWRIAFKEPESAADTDYEHIDLGRYGAVFPAEFSLDVDGTFHGDALIAPQLEPEHEESYPELLPDDVLFVHPAPGFSVGYRIEYAHDERPYEYRLIRDERFDVGFVE